MSQNLSIQKGSPPMYNPSSNRGLTNGPVRLVWKINENFIMKKLSGGKKFGFHNKNFCSASTVANSSIYDTSDVEVSPVKNEEKDKTDLADNFVSVEDFKKLQERLKYLEKNRVFT